MDRQELYSYRRILKKVELDRLRTLYAETLLQCSLNGTKLPQIRHLQGLVQLWRELDRRNRKPQ
jgi:hypothetical protein